MVAPYWTNRLARPDDLDAIMALVRAVHGDAYPELDRDYWLWRYRSGPACRCDVLVAEFEGRPIGVLPTAEFEFQWGERRLLGQMLTGLLTHPEHRRRGIFRSLIDSASENAVRHGRLFHMGMPNEAALPGYLKFGGWVYVGLIPLFVKLIDVPAVLRPRLGGKLAGLLGCVPQAAVRGVRGGLGGGWAGEVVAEVSEEVDALADAWARENGGLMIRRTAAYWNWRYGERPGWDYRTIVVSRDGEVMGAVATSVRRFGGVPVGLVMDLVGRGGGVTVRQLIRWAEDDLRSRGAGVATCQATSGLLQRALRQEGYILPAAGWLPKKFHYVYRPLGIAGLPGAPRRISDWHLMFGDSDNV